MSKIKTVSDRIARESRELKEFYLNSKINPSQVRVLTLRSVVDGELSLRKVLKDKGKEYEIVVKVLFLPEHERVLLLTWYYVDGEQKTFSNHRDKGEAIIETEKSLLENLTMDFQNLIIQ